MTIVIGFIPRNGICQAEVILPVGFLKTGECIENKDCLANCTLIFLEDTHYDPNDRWDCFQGNGKDALLFQHNSNSDAWERQIKWLSDHGWQPRHFSSFSRTETEGKFMEVTRKVLCDEDMTVIKPFLEWVESQDIFKMLDNFAAWEIIRPIKNDKKIEDQVKKAFKDLPPDIQGKIRALPEGENGYPLLTDLINVLNQASVDILQ